MTNVTKFTGYKHAYIKQFINISEETSDHYVLSLMIQLVLPQAEADTLTAFLLNKYGCLAKLVRLSKEDMMKEEAMTEEIATILSSLYHLGLRVLECNITNRPILECWDDVIQYCKATMNHRRTEQLKIIYLNKKNEIIADELQHEGTIDQTAAYPREIIKRALELDATALILVHNHPSGDETPTLTDIQITRRTINAAEPFDIIVHDHLIVSSNGIESLKKLNLI